MSRTVPSAGRFSELGTGNDSRLTLYRNGSVYSPADPFATAMLVDGATVAWVGGEHAAASLLDPRMTVVDLDGALVAPGFVDSHVHLTETGRSLEALDLRGAETREQVLDTVREAAARTDRGLLEGHGWDESRWPDQRPPSAAELDRASGGKDVYLARVDLHSGAVSATLAAKAELAQRDGWTPEGWVSGAAHAAARRYARDAPTVSRAAYQQAALLHAAAQGIVAVAEMGAPEIEPIEDLLRLMNGNDGVRQAGPEVLPYWGQVLNSSQELEELIALFGGRLRGVAGDLNIDGSLGSRTALLREPYADASETHGRLLLDEAAVMRHLGIATASRMQAGFHVIGDAALDVALAALTKTADELGIEAVRASRHRLEHVELADKAAIAALSHFGVTVSMQPGFDAAWGGQGQMYARRLGADRAQDMNPVGSMLSAGVALCLGSDSPVLPMDPWASVRACLEHSNPDERISARAAFVAHTRAGWRAAGSADPLLGQLVPGSPASFAVWEAAELMVQTPDSRVQSWSTDPRAGTPLLPALDTGERPRCLETRHHGELLFSSYE